MSGEERIHLSASIAGLLRRSDRELDGILTIKGEPASASMARKHLEAAQAEGKTLIRTCDEAECPDFDEFGGGCPGHPLEVDA